MIFVGFDGFPQAYDLLKDKYLDADGVQNLFYAATLAINALTDMQAGKEPDKLLIDPGFAINQANLEQKKGEMTALPGFRFSICRGQARLPSYDNRLIISYHAPPTAGPPFKGQREPTLLGSPGRVTVFLVC